ncbi:hypothetical protein HPB47_014448, partial [Ixodes persulcatus]
RPAMDSARSWVLAAACCWINIFSFAMFRAAQVIYVGIMTTYHVTRQQAAWPLFITGVIYSAAGGTCESRCLESGVSTGPEPSGLARPRLAVRGFAVSGEKGILVVEPSPGKKEGVFRFKALGEASTSKEVPVPAAPSAVQPEEERMELAAIIYTALLNSLNITREEASWPVTLMGIFLCVAVSGSDGLARRCPKGEGMVPVVPRESMPTLLAYPRTPPRVSHLRGTCEIVWAVLRMDGRLARIPEVDSGRRVECEKIL